MKNKLSVISLASLLHDIGKVGQRAFSSDAGLSNDSLGLAEYLCPSSKRGYLTRKHALYTNEFIEAVKMYFPDKINTSELANLASYHHKPSDDNQKIITEADYLSSAMDRESMDSSGERTDFRKTLQSPVSNYIAIQPNCQKSNQYKYNLNKYSTNSIFPTLLDNPDNQINNYNSIWINLLDTMKNVKISDEIQFINTLLSILEKYLWAVPSATNVDVPDVSLYDHLKTTSAIAGCLYLSNDKEKPFILAAGDFGGIQKYIFNLKSGSGGIAKALRGRSFDVGTFSDSTAFGILNELKLPMSQLIMYSGGKFYLLLPNTDITLEVLNNQQNKLHDWILEERNGELRFNMSWEKISKDDIEDFPTALLKINEKLNEASFKGLKSLQKNNKWLEDKWLRPGYSDKYEELCKSCHSNAIKHTSGENEGLCARCSADRETGRKLVKSNYLALPSKELLKQTTESERASDLIIEFRGEVQNKYDMPYFTILKNNWVPRNENNNVQEFDWIAKQSAGKKMLGYLKADVDNLGYIFQKGFVTEGTAKKNRASISRLATLSRQMEYFFSGYIYNLLKEKYNAVYTVFSGGDDLFLIGPWNQVFDIALELRSEFARYTCYNKSWGLSAGVTVVNPKTPVLHGQQLASNNLDISKNETGKDSITAFATSLSWDEYADALKQGKQLVQWIKDGALNTSKIYRFFQYGRELKEFHSSGNTSLLRVIPQMIYDLTRNWGNRTDSQKEAKKWAQAFTNPENKDSRTLPFICEYALTKTK
ncbi:MAG: type III-A CRISPR-associated protein Cas10/Csm1 [candidate division Zixibacteria bacterium]|nr:type III-A CRISPR-associated protein Cas10/Csm1 [candidate division Zixibacteria bacterium]